MRERLFCPMAAISWRWRGGRIIIIRVRASRCGEGALNPADLTTHSPPKICSRPSTATRPSRAFSHSLPAPTHARRPHNTFPAEDLRPSRAFSHSLPAHFRSPTQRRRTPADLTTHFPQKICSRPSTATRPSRAFSHSHAAPTHTRRLRDAFLADLTTHSPPKAVTRPRTATRPTRALSHSLPAPTHLTQRRRTPAGCAMHFPPTSQPIPRRRPSPAPHSDTPLPFCSASGTKKRHRTVDVRCRMSRSTVVAVGHWGW